VIGSSSILSQLAALFSDMPWIWLKTERVPEQPTSQGIPTVGIEEVSDAVRRELTFRDGMKATDREVIPGI
jgi:hypothetical protein